jgi:hypothetical protein
MFDTFTDARSNTCPTLPLSYYAMRLGSDNYRSPDTGLDVPRAQSDVLQDKIKISDLRVMVVSDWLRIGYPNTYPIVDIRYGKYGIVRYKLYQIERVFNKISPSISDAI